MNPTRRTLSVEEVELARAFGARRTLGVALRAAGLVAGGQPGETLFREAIEVLAGPAGAKSCWTNIPTGPKCL